MVEERSLETLPVANREASSVPIASSLFYSDGEYCYRPWPITSRIPIPRIGGETPSRFSVGVPILAAAHIQHLAA